MEEEKLLCKSCSWVVENLENGNIKSKHNDKKISELLLTITTMIIDKLYWLY